MTAKIVVVDASTTFSKSDHMITYDRKSNIGFDFDVNIEVNDYDENYEPKEIRTIIRKALDKVARQYGYDYSCFHAIVMMD